MPKLLITACIRTSNGVSISTQVVDYECVFESEKVFAQICSDYAHTQDFERVKLTADRLYARPKS